MIKNHMKYVLVMMSLLIPVQASEVLEATELRPEGVVITEEKITTEEKPMSGYLNIETDESQSQHFSGWKEVKKGGKKIADIGTLIVLRPIIIVTAPIWIPALCCLYKGTINHYL